MKKLILLISILSLSACGNFVPNDEARFGYAYKNKCTPDSKLLICKKPF